MAPSVFTLVFPFRPHLTPTPVISPEVTHYVFLHFFLRSICFPDFSELWVFPASPSKGQSQHSGVGQG